MFVLLQTYELVKNSKPNVLFSEAISMDNVKPKMIDFKDAVSLTQATE